jgi:hypothetical protein
MGLCTVFGYRRGNWKLAQNWGGKCGFIGEYWNFGNGDGNIEPSYAEASTFAKVTDILEELSEKYPQKVVEPVVKCFEQSSTKDYTVFKGELLKILGKVGNEYSCQPKVIPIVMIGLMDYESPYLRAVAVRAVEETFRHSNVKPPENILDVIVLHLRDQYVAVHKGYGGRDGGQASNAEHRMSQSHGGSGR